MLEYVVKSAFCGPAFFESKGCFFCKESVVCLKLPGGGIENIFSLLPKEVRLSGELDVFFRGDPLLLKVEGALRTMFRFEDALLSGCRGSEEANGIGAWPESGS